MPVATAFGRLQRQHLQGSLWLAKLSSPSAAVQAGGSLDKNNERSNPFMKWMGEKVQEGCAADCHSSFAT